MDEKGMLTLAVNKLYKESLLTKELFLFGLEQQEGVVAISENGFTAAVYGAVYSCQFVGDELVCDIHTTTH
jgi:hypothetical protein